MKKILVFILLLNLLSSKLLEKNILLPKKQKTNKITILGKELNLPEGDKFYVIPLDCNTKSKHPDEELTQNESNQNSGFARYADGIVIESKGKFGMIDLYRRNYYPTVKKFLKDLRIKELEFILFSHMHGDHIGDLQLLAKDFKVKSIYMKDGTKNNVKSATYREYRDYARKHNIKLNFVSQENHKSFTFENMLFELHNRPLRPTEKGGHENGNSLTALVRSYGGKTIYFSGDIQRVKTGGAYHNYGIETAKEVGKVDIYKVAHHGNYKANNLPEEIKILSPKYSVMTIDSEMAVATKRLKDVGSQVYRAGIHHDGIVVFNIDPYGVISVHKTK